MFVNSYKKGNTIVKAHLKHNVRKDNKSNCPLNSGNKLNNQELQSIYNNIKYKELVVKNIIKDRMNKNRYHSLDASIEFLIEVLSPDENIRNQVKFQFNEYVFKGL